MKARVIMMVGAPRGAAAADVAMIKGLIKPIDIFIAKPRSKDSQAWLQAAALRPEAGRARPSPLCAKAS